MHESQVLRRMRHLYPRVQWLEPHNKKSIRMIQIGLGLSMVLSVLFMSIMAVIPLMLEQILQMRETLVILASLFLFMVSVCGSIWVAYKELDNRIGTDGERVYFVDFKGKVWAGAPGDVFVGCKQLAGGPVPVLIRDIDRRFLYREEELVSLLGQAVKRGCPGGLIRMLSADRRRRRYLVRNGYPIPRLIVKEAPFIVGIVIVSIDLVLWIMLGGGFGLDSTLERVRRVLGAGATEEASSVF